MTSFATFKQSRGLEVNTLKTFIMKCCKNSAKCRDILINNTKVECINRIPYFGIHFDHRGTWSFAVLARNLLFSKPTGALVNFARRLGRRPVPELIQIYKAKCITTAMYGAGIWGHTDAQPLQLIENAFTRYLLAVPNSTATFICHSELGISYISDLFKM